MLDKKEVIQLLVNEPIKIAEAVGFGKFTDLHNEWLKEFVFGKEDYTLQAHRGSYKSTINSVGNALFMLLYPKQNTIMLRKTDDDVKESVKQTIKVLESSVMQGVCKVLYGQELAFTHKSVYSISTNLYTSPRGASQLLGLGLGASITGKHSDRIVTDDIVNVKDRVSRAEREHTKLAYMELQNIKNRGGRILNLGTPWHKDDAFMLMERPARYDCYSTGLISKEQIAQIRSSMSNSLFAANYELKHIASEDVLFDTAPKFTEDSKKIYHGIAHIDAAYGGEDSSVLTIARRFKNTIYVLGKTQQKHIDKCLDGYIALVKQYRSGTLYCEKNADKGYLAKEIRRKGLPCNNYNESMNKFLKISTYLKKWWPNIVFIEGTDSAYIDNILEYNEQAEHDDSCDSLASIVRVLDKLA